MDHTEGKMKENYLLFGILSIAGLTLITGIVFPFTNLEILESEYQDSEFISALFTLAGTLLFSAALVYQIREYKVQVEELKKSVEAQTKSSQALEEQKTLLLEQNTNSLIFKMIDSFNEFKKNELIQESIKYYYDHSKQKINSYYAGMRMDIKSKEEFNRELALGIKQNFMQTVQNGNNYSLKKFVQFAYNIFYLIGQKQIPEQKDWFTPFIHIHLSKEEYLILYLTSLVDYGMPLSDRLQWNYHLTIELIEMINPIKERANYKLLDPSTLTEELNKIKQKL